MDKNPYEVLGVNEDATEDEIKKAYKTKAKKCHPDIAKDDGEEFKELSWAYELLKDGEMRAHYDQFGMDPNSKESMRLVEIMNALCIVFDEISKSVSADELEKFDLIGVMKNGIRLKIEAIEGLINMLSEQKEKIEKFQKIIEERLKRKNKDKARQSPNFFLETLKRRISQEKAKIQGQEHLLDVAKGMMEVVDEFDFTFDERPKLIQSQFHGSTARGLGGTSLWRGGF